LIRGFSSEALPFANLPFAILGGWFPFWAPPWNPDLHHATASGGDFGYGTIFVLSPKASSWFTSISINPDRTLEINAVGSAGAQFRLQSSANALLPSWMDLTTNTANALGALVFTNLPLEAPQQFYRLATP